MNKLKYIVGDVTCQPFSGTLIIPHCCNDIPAMGAGVARKLYEKWPNVRSEYYSHQNDIKLGDCYMVKVENNIYVANMIGQHGVCTHRVDGIALCDDGCPPVRYIALAIAMKRIEKFIKENNIKDPIIHCPKFGSDLAGGNWQFIAELIREAWLPICPVNVCVIDKNQMP